MKTTVGALQVEYLSIQILHKVYFLHLYGEKGICSNSNKNRSLVVQKFGFVVRIGGGKKKRKKKKTKLPTFKEIAD